LTERPQIRLDLFQHRLRQTPTEIGAEKGVVVVLIAELRRLIHGPNHDHYIRASESRRQRATAAEACTLVCVMRLSICDSPNRCPTMPLQYENLDPTTRRYALAELEHDQA